MRKPLLKTRQLLLLAYLLAAVLWVVRCLVGCGVMLNYKLQGKMPQTHVDAAELVTESFAPYSSNEWWTPPDDDPAWYLSTDSDPHIYWQGQGYIETAVLDAAHRLPPGGVALYYLGMLYDHFTIHDFWQIRVPGWVGLVLAALGQGITVTGLRQDSRQGDRRALTLCRELPQQVSLRENPDLLPPLALLAALRPDKEMRFTDAARLRHKESDRLAATAALLTALGGRAQETADGLAVRGVACLQGGEVQSAGDHRLAMLAACAAPFCREPVVLRGADCTAKSYPAFWRDYAQLGGKVEHLT